MTLTKLSYVTAIGLALIGKAEAQSVGGAASISATTTSANVALPVSTATYPSVVLSPAPGTSQEMFYALGGAAVAATVASPALPAGGICVNVGPNTYIAAITASSTATLRITQVTTCPIFSGR
jgi:hypothetical protein